MRSGPFLVLLVASSGPALAEDARTDRARQQIEQQLNRMVKLPPALMEIVFDGIDSTRYRLLEANFAVDGETLPGKIPAGQGKTVLFSGNLAPGSHSLTAKLVYEEAVRDGLFGYATGTKFKVPGKFIFTAQRGVFMRVHTRIEVDDGAEPKKRLQLVGNVETDLRAKLEDGLLPAHPEKQASLEESAGPTQSASPAQSASEVQPEPLTQTTKRHRTESKVKLAAAAGNGTGSVKEAIGVGGAPGAGPSEVDGGSAAASLDAGAESAPTSATVSAPQVDAGAAVATATAPESVPSMPRRASEGFGAMDIAVGIGGIALTAILVFAFARRRN